MIEEFGQKKYEYSIVQVDYQTGEQYIITMFLNMEITI